MFGTSPFGVAPFGAKIIVDTGPVPNIGTIEITAPKPAVFCSFAYASATLTAPAPSLSFVAHDSYGENAIIVTAPKPTLSARGGAYAALTAPVPTLSAAMTGTAMLNAALSAPAPSLSSTATGAYVANAILTVPTPNLIGYGGAVCSITTSAGTLTASGTGGGVAHVAITVPLAQLTASATAQNYGSAILVAPAGRMAPTLQAYLVAPAATLTAIGTATITATYEAYTLNLNHSPGHPGETVVDETTRYTNFPFTHVIRYQNSYYGVSDGSLYLLEGTTDDGVDIPYEVVTAKTDFGQTLTKTLVSAYLGGRIGPAETITLIAGDSAPVSYAYTTPRGPHAQNYRQKFGRGIKDRYYALGVSGAAEFSLDTIDIELNQLTRRI